MKDILGTEIAVGCTIAYPDRRGSSMWLNTGVVQEINGGIKRYDPWLGWHVVGQSVRVRSTCHRFGTSEPRSRATWVNAIERIVVVRPAPMMPSVGSGGTITSAEVGDLSVQLATGHA